jgi:cobalamin biosynthesis protein CobW
VAVPILLVTGFLGAGKTTLINQLLTEPGGRRLAAIVNDFGAINIDAELLAGATDGLVSLKNGCICCSLQGDLLRTLATILRRAPVPDGIVIETSGVSDPAEIVRALLDPVIWREAALDAVICVADARYLTDRPALREDPLWQSQIRAADFVALNKTDLVSPAECAAVRAGLAGFKPDRVIFDVEQARVPPELLFSAGLHQAGMAPGRAVFSTPRFESMTWRAPRALSLPRFQAAIGRLAGRVIRAKGILLFQEQPGRPMLFQLVGERATISPTAAGADGQPVRLVLIAENGSLQAEQTTALLESCL